MKSVRIDIISDVVCPWCLLGYRQLELLLADYSDQAHFELHWQPFELNPSMPKGGEPLNLHLQKKYHLSSDDIKHSQTHLIERGRTLGIALSFPSQMRMYNTRKAHQLMIWASQEAKHLDLKKRLFDAYFLQNLAIDQDSVLIKLGKSAGLDPSICKQVITDSSWSNTVAKTEQQWLDAGIQAVPTFIFAQHKVLSGLQKPETFHQAIEDAIRRSPPLH